jgi:hypothetical protein
MESVADKFEDEEFFCFTEVKVDEHTFKGGNGDA